jgi:putative inorganic carbon (HCO3(-)) transporter
VNKTQVNRIALINFGGIGDELLFSPVLVAIKLLFPEAETTLFLEKRSQAVTPLLPGVDRFETLTIQGKNKVLAAGELLSYLQARRFDLVLSSGSNPLIAPLLWLSGIPLRFGFDSDRLSKGFLTQAAPLVKNRYAGEMYYALAEALINWHTHQSSNKTEIAVSPLPKIQLNPEFTKVSWLEKKPSRPLILVHPGVSRVSIEKGIYKTWAAENWSRCIQALCQNADVCLVGGPDDQEIVDAILKALPAKLTGFQNGYGLTKSLTDLALALQTADLLLSVDSSPLHLAIALNTPTVAIFGPTDEKKLMPDPALYPQFQAVILPDLSCRPCLWDVRQTNCEASTCLDVPVDLVVQSVQSQLSRLAVATQAAYESS